MAKNINYLDPACMGQKVPNCYHQKIVGNLPDPQEAAAYQVCWYQSFPSCTTTIDVPTADEVQAAMDAANKRQQTEWATWLATLQATGVVKTPPPAPQPQQPPPHH